MLREVITLASSILVAVTYFELGIYYLMLLRTEISMDDPDSDTATRIINDALVSFGYVFIAILISYMHNVITDTLAVLFLVLWAIGSFVVYIRLRFK